MSDAAPAGGRADGILEVLLRVRRRGCDFGPLGLAAHARELVEMVRAGPAGANGGDPAQAVSELVRDAAAAIADDHVRDVFEFVCLERPPGMTISRRRGEAEDR